MIFFFLHGKFCLAESFVVCQIGKPFCCSSFINVILFSWKIDLSVGKFNKFASSRVQEYVWASVVQEDKINSVLLLHLVFSVESLFNQI